MTDIETYIDESIWHAALCLQWQASDASPNGGNGYPISDGGDEWTDAVAGIPELRDYVADFVTLNWEILESDGIDSAACGHNFVLTANGHGTGFWDRGYPHGEELSDACKPYGELDAEFQLWGDDADGDINLSDEVRFLSVMNTLIMGSYPE